MAKIHIKQKPAVEKIDKFLGLNLDTTGDTGLKLGESGEMYNWRITENYKLRRRFGYAEQITALDGNVNGLWYGRISGEDFLLFAMDTTLYARVTLSGTDFASLDTSTYSNVDIILSTALDATTAGTTAADGLVAVADMEEVAAIDIDYGVSSGKFYYDSAKKVSLIVLKGTYTDIAEARTDLGEVYAYIPIGTCADDNVRFFAFNDKVYIQDGVKYQSWSGTGAVSEPVGYVPITYTATPPAGGGTAFEGINLLNPQRRIRYNADGIETDYQLPETGIDSVDYVYVDDVLQTVTVDYTVNLTTGQVIFTVAPTTGENNVEIYWTYDTGTRDEIATCRANMLFGGKNDTRVFVWGHGTYINRCYYTDLDGDGLPSAEYFPALFYNEVGSTEYPITDIVRQYDRQIIFKENETWYSYYDAYTDVDQYTTVTFPVFTLNQRKGNVAFDQVRLVANNPLSISQGILEWVSTAVRDERNAQYISKRIQPDLDLIDLSTAITADWEARWEYWIAVGNHIWIYNYRLDVWYKYILLDTPTVIKIIDDELYFGTSSTLMKFDSETTSDNGSPFQSYWEMNMYDFKANWIRKQIDLMWVGLKPEVNAEITVGWISDRETCPTASKKTITHKLFSFETIDFSSFTFNTNYTPKPFRIKIKSNKATYFKATFEVSSATAIATILDLSIHAMFDGQSK
jgi:outer membrane lipoprotein-sorting protein